MPPKDAENGGRACKPKAPNLRFRWGGVLADLKLFHLLLTSTVSARVINLEKAKHHVDVYVLSA